MPADADRTEEGLPPSVSLDLTQRVSSYWLDRVRQHTSDRYAGVAISKFPEDLRTYEHLLWASRANVVIELGAQFGASALWFRDRLRTMEQYGRISGAHVLAIDIDIAPARAALADADPDYAATITLLEGDVRDLDLPDRVEGLLGKTGSRCLVVEDSAHTYDTTAAALRGFTRFVPLHGYFVVEDGCVDIDAMRAFEDWPRGSSFRVRRDLECYGLSCHPGGFLERIASEP
jgi:cephalosporin hydroxylase